MAELKCKNCGGTMEADETNSYAICEYCGEKQKIEKSEAEIKAEILKKKEQERIELKERLKEKTKETEKKIKKIVKIILICVIVVVIFYAVMMIILLVTDDSNNTSETNSALDIAVSDTIESTTEIASQNKAIENIEILDLFESLEKAKTVLGEETRDPQNIENYTKYSFEDVTVLCEYGTNNVYSISVEYNLENSKNKYTILGINGNSTQSDWDNTLGEMDYTNYGSYGNPICGYNIEYYGLEYTVEIVSTGNNPDKIIIYKGYYTE